jgi:hypothetical protein
MKKQVSQSILKKVAEEISEKQNIPLKDAIKIVVRDLDKYGDYLLLLERQDVKRHE